MIPRRITSFLFMLAGGLAFALLPAAGQNRNFGDITQVTAVEIPVQVVRDGEPVRGLTAKDFEVFEGRTKQPVVGFDVADLAAAAPSGGGVLPVPAAACGERLVARRRSTGVADD